MIWLQIMIVWIVLSVVIVGGLWLPDEKHRGRGRGR